ncbi:hypothetical protein BOO69_08300 [Sulfitobacter alexandrii]|uniref:Uncharacterized protein n=1 Tax=Sulfitobacter alexandrii TaxID=1917485 RepID=A0A1J0WGH7_9RHOB|nr:hypothetical protein [Sulfitobacter alexandrii]APE43417.1 hypothetical protein BOO69_08300 [Sulfitobacter alexandrii]
MNREIVDVSRGLFAQLTFDWDIDWRGQSIGETTSGVSKVVYNAFPRWVGSPTVLLNRAQISQWRAVRASARGLVNLYRIRMCDPIGSAHSFAGATQATRKRGLPFATGRRFSTGWGFRFEPFVEAVGAALAGAETMRIEIPSGGIAPVVGQIMSHDDLPFMVTWIEPISADTFEIGIQMPLRRAIPAGAEIRMRGTGIFEATEEAMGLPAYGAGRTSTPRLLLQEWLR